MKGTAARACRYGGEAGQVTAGRSTYSFLPAALTRPADYSRDQVPLDVVVNMVKRAKRAKRVKRGQARPADYACYLGRTSQTGLNGHTVGSSQAEQRPQADQADQLVKR
jgi:hypothetical protein